MAKKGRPQRNTNVRPTDEELLDAVLVALGTHGPNASMDTLARDANTTKQTLYAHFGSKDALLDRLQEREYGELRTRLFTAYDGLEQDAAVEAQLRACIEPLFAYAAERPEGSRLLTDERAPHRTQRSLDLLGEITQRIFADGAERTGVRSAALPIVAPMIPAAALAGGTAAIESGIEPDTAIETMIAFFAGAIANTVLPTKSATSAIVP